MGIVNKPTIYGDDWGMVYNCYTHIALLDVVSTRKWKPRDPVGQSKPKRAEESRQVRRLLPLTSFFQLTRGDQGEYSVTHNYGM